MEQAKSYDQSNNQSGFPHLNMNWRYVHKQPQQAYEISPADVGTSYFPPSSTQDISKEATGSTCRMMVGFLLALFSVCLRMHYNSRLTCKLVSFVVQFYSLSIFHNMYE